MLQLYNFHLLFNSRRTFSTTYTIHWNFYVFNQHHTYWLLLLNGMYSEHCFSQISQSRQLNTQISQMICYALNLSFQSALIYRKKGNCTHYTHALIQFFVKYLSLRSPKNVWIHLLFSPWNTFKKRDKQTQWATVLKQIIKIIMLHCI